MNQITTDIVIVGGGIAGLWLLNILRKQGFSVILLEQDSLGAGQTIKSQGIIHGGLKYALAGSINSATTALNSMPTRWQAALANKGELDLTTVEVLATHQYMWSINKITGPLATLFASKTLKSFVAIEENIPTILTQTNLQGRLYKLNEIVLNVESLIKTLSKPHLRSCLKLKYHHELPITAQKVIFTAGSGNLEFHSKTQLRPLHMVLVKSKNLLPLYGHCIGLSNLPRITITTHIAKDSNPVWYLGGRLAEDGVNIDSHEQIRRAQHELTTIFPSLNLNDAKWASFIVNRAEMSQSNGQKPDSVSITINDDNIFAWPTKLALTPILGDKICEILQAANIRPKYVQPQNLAHFSPATIASPIWDELL